MNKVKVGTLFARSPALRLCLFAILIFASFKVAAEAPLIKKLGTIDCDMVETTPIVFKGHLYRFEYVREGYKPNTTGKSYFRFIDVENGNVTPAFAQGQQLGSAYAEGETMYAFGVDHWGGTTISVFWSKDLRTWAPQTALNLPGWGIFNNSVCKGDGDYVMAFEIDKPPEETGVAFTTRFARSNDLKSWKLTAPECVFAKDRYTACPSIRYLEGKYYMVYLESRSGPAWETHVVRSKDLIQWESSALNPVLKFSPEDKQIANPHLTPEQRQRIEKAVDRNNSDLDFCEWNGQVILNYSWGNQEGNEFLAEARYDGSLKNFLLGYFPQSNSK